MKNFKPFGLSVPSILLPREDIALSSWAVVACDQYTQDRDYWKKAEHAAGNEPSTLDLILPEVYLKDSDRQERINKIHGIMEEYLKTEVFREPVEGFIYVERKTAYNRVRKGLVVAVDLDAYQWEPFAKSLVRATEATIEDRIPPRMEIRRGAALELPHIMLLINDPKKEFVEELGKRAKTRQPLYHGDLMLNSGSIEGYLVAGDDLDFCVSRLEVLTKDSVGEDGSPFLFAVGDGNHSLATAKAVWKEYKSQQQASGVPWETIENSPLRYALVEIVNLYDDGLTFEPIHRVLLHTEAEKLIQFCSEKLQGKGSFVADAETLEKKVKNSVSAIGFVYRDSKDKKEKYFLFDVACKGLCISYLQPVLDAYMACCNGEAEIDYIHGSEEVFRLGAEEGNIAILMPPIAKDSFFSTIAAKGPLPRKTFSMGEASEKRFYLEARKLTE